MIRLVLPAVDITEFDRCVQLSAAIARGDTGAGRIANLSPPALSRDGRNSRSISRSRGYSAGAVRLQSGDRRSHRSHHHRGEGACRGCTGSGGMYRGGGESSPSQVTPSQR